jgi:tRNA (guanosine-2'-O-)-methyltransferase
MSLVLGCALATVACSEVAAPRDPYALRDASTPDGSSLEMACTPSGIELCFDAVDNNCNGVIDEGCGVHTGTLQFMIAWNEPSADVDLTVTDPDGDSAFLGEPTPSGLLKDRECPPKTGACLGQNIENVYLVENEPEKGRYRVAVRLKKLGDATAPIRVHLGARVGQRTYQFAFDLKPGEGSSEKGFEFTL